MKKLSIIITILTLTACEITDSTEEKTTQAVQRQQAQYLVAQPVPAYDWSLERDLVIQLYNIRNLRAVTHSVWRSDRGLIEGDCASLGFGIPYDTSLTNPLMMAHGYQSVTSIGQAEPNGVYASTNTAATWVMCAGKAGQIEPVYIETKVTVFPYPVSVDYATNLVTKAGEATVTISTN